MTTGRVWTIAALGWALFALTLWYHHKAPPPVEVPPETRKALEREGFTESTVSTTPPARVIRETVHVPGAERIVYIELEAKPTEEKPPKVRVVPGNCADGAVQLPNWALRPGDLGLRGGALDVRKVGRHGFVKFNATLTAQTPEGETTRAIAPDAESWLSTKALGIPPRLGPTFRGSMSLTKLELRSLEGGLYWTKGRIQHDVTAGHDFRADDWFTSYGVRF